MKALQLDTEGESRPHLCSSAFFDQAYNWRTGGFNLWRCRLPRGHKGPHEDYIGVNLHDGGMSYIRVQWTDWRKQEHLNDQEKFWQNVDKENRRC